MTMQTVQIEFRADFIDLGVGQPASALLPAQIIRRAAEHRLAHDAAAYLQYGTEQGDGYFRDALAQFLSDGYGFSIQADQLFVSSGASQALDLICTLFVPPGAVVCVEEPTYFLALNILADHHLHVVSLPTDERGLIVEELEDRLAQLRPALLYLIPAFQNPTGATLPRERRERLVELSHQYDFLIVADEVYHFLNYSTTPPPSFGAYVDDGQVLALGSFSKILAPGLRLGWVQAEASRVQRMVLSGLLDSGGGLNPFTSGLVRSVLELDLQRPYLAELRATYQQRIAAMEAALQQCLPDATYAVPQGGYFFWLRLPDHIDAEALLPRANELKVGYRPGIRFSSQQGLRNYARLSFAFYDSETLVEGVRRLGQAVDRYRA
jgi:DNA-binding transcriptional MocR family regulator